MATIKRNRFFDAETCLGNRGTKSPLSNDQFDHFERYSRLEFVFSS